MSFVIFSKWILSYTCVSVAHWQNPVAPPFMNAVDLPDEWAIRAFSCSLRHHSDGRCFCNMFYTYDGWLSKEKRRLCCTAHIQGSGYRFLLHWQRSFIGLSDENNFLSSCLTGRTAFEIQLTRSTKQQLESLHAAKMPWHWCVRLAAEKLKAYFTVCIVGRREISCSCGI